MRLDYSDKFYSKRINVDYRINKKIIFYTEKIKNLRLHNFVYY